MQRRTWTAEPISWSVSSGAANPSALADRYRVSCRMYDNAIPVRLEFLVSPLLYRSNFDHCPICSDVRGDVAN